MISLELRHLPNLISIVRCILVVPVVVTILQGRFSWALTLFVLAGVSDAADGFLAKTFGWQSRLGSFLDPLADKLLLVSCYVALAALDLVPLWLSALVVLRDVIILGGAVAYHVLRGPFEGQPLLLSKLNTLLQLGLVVAVLVDQGWTALPEPLGAALQLGVTLTTLGSGAQYIVVWTERYRRG